MVVAAGDSGFATVEALQPVILEWAGRQHGTLSFRLTQVLSGHGCFGKYLHLVARRELSPACHHCDCCEDSAQHTLAVCPAWAPQRRALSAVIGGDLSLPAVVRFMAGGESSFTAVATFCEEVISQKEAAEKAREDDLHSDPIRRRRTGRRRCAYQRLMPP